MLGGIFIIMAFYLLGECCAWLVNGFVPGSVLGMMFRPVARFLCDNMAFFFLPAGVGIITSMDVLSRYWDIVLVVGTVTTLLVLVVVALLQQWQEDRRARG